MLKDIDLNEILSEPDPDRLIVKLCDLVVDNDLGGMTDKQLRSAPFFAKLVLDVYAFSLEVGSSGIVGWVCELSQSQPDIEKHFLKIGAKNAAKYVSSACAVFPGGKVPSNEIDERPELVDEHEPKFRTLDKKYSERRRKRFFR